jgi:hypothetical protein
MKTPFTFPFRGPTPTSPTSADVGSQRGLVRAFADVAIEDDFVAGDDGFGRYRMAAAEQRSGRGGTNWPDGPRRSIGDELVGCG